MAELLPKQHFPPWPNLPTKILILAVYSFVITFLAYVVFGLKYPMRLPSSDIYHLLASLNELQKVLAKVNDPFFATGPNDPHYGPYLVLISFLSSILSVEILPLFLLFGVINVVFLLVCAYYFAKVFHLDNDTKLKVQYIFPLFMLVLWGPSRLLIAGFYSLADLVYTAPFPATFGLALLLLNLGIGKKFLNNPNNLMYTTFVLSTTLLFLSHMLSGVFFFFLLGFLIITDAVKKRKIESRHILLSAAPFMTLALSMFWPYFSVFETLKETLKIEVGPLKMAVVYPLQIYNWIYVAPIALLGIVGVWRHKNRNWFFLGWLGFSFLISISYTLPVRLPLSWRFFPVMLIPLFLYVTDFLVTMGLRQRFLLILLMPLLVTYGVLTFISKAPFPNTSRAITPEEFNFLDKVPKNSVVLSDPMTSYHIAGLKGFSVIAIHYGHANPNYMLENMQRYEQTVRFFKWEMTAIEKKQFQAKYKPNYLLLNLKYYPDYIRVGPDSLEMNKIREKFSKKRIIVYKNKQYILIELSSAFGLSTNQ